MRINNPVILLCIQGTQAEFASLPDAAQALYQQAWEIASDDYEKCVAAHYVARSYTAPADILYWNQQALRCAEAATAANDARVNEFYPSLYLSLGRAYELIDNQPEAQHYYALAASLGFTHQAD